MFRIALVCAFLCSISLAHAADAPSQSSSEIPMSSLVVVKHIGWALHHSSLDGLPPVPQAGLVFKLHCRIADDRLVDCNAACDCGAEGDPFLPAALKRAAAIRVSPRAKDGAAVSGLRTLLQLRISPSDRFDGTTVDFSRGDQVIFSARPNGMDLRRY